MEVKKGYKQTELGIIPEDWDALSIYEVAKITTGGSDTQDRIDDGEYPFFVRSQKVERINQFTMNCEAILTSGDGVGVGKIFHYVNEKFDFHQRVYCIYDFNQKTTGKYLYYQFSTSFYNRVMQLTAKSSVDSVRREMIAEMVLPFPKKVSEQTAIANALSDMDALINQTEKLIEKKKAIKQGAMQELLKPKEGWVTKKLGEIVSVIKSGGTPLTSNREYYNGEIPFLSISDMTNQGKFLNYTSSNISQEGLDNSSSWLVQKESLIYSMYASVGFVSLNKIDIAISQAVLGMKFKEFINLDFMYYALVSMQKSVLKFVGEGTQKNLNAASVKNFDITFPSIFEQKNISMILNEIDQDINLTVHKLTKLKQQKQGMMQALLTGKIRLV